MGGSIATGQEIRVTTQGMIRAVPHLTLGNARRHLHDTEATAFSDQLGAVDGVVAVAAESARSEAQER